MVFYPPHNVESISNKQTHQILCLANSIKHGGRCIAGLRTDGKGWIRPVSPRDEGGLTLDEYRLSNHENPQILDILDIEFFSPNPKPHQPENWLISPKTWHLSQRFNKTTDKKNILDFLNSHISSSTLLFGNSGDRLNYNKFLVKPSQSSLALIKPNNLSFLSKIYNGHKKIRACFTIGNINYDLALTDPLIKAKLETLPHDSYSPENLGIVHDNYTNIFLTISLGEPFQDQCCYKLVAGVLFI